MPSYYLGLDVHKRTTSYCLTDPTGKIIAEASLPTAQVTSIVPDHDCAVVLEATGTWHHTYDSLSGCCASVTLAHPAAIRAIASARIKTDRIDARILAHLLRADLIPRSWAPPPEVRELRDLVRLRWRFVSQRTQAKNRISNLLARRGLAASATDLFGTAGRSWISDLELDRHTRLLIDELLEAISEADAHVAHLTALLHERLDAEPALALLCSIPGVGFLTAATLLAELGDWRRFGTARQVSAYFGIAPGVRASGGVVKRGHITRSGSCHARRALVEAAHVAVRLPGPLRSRYLRVAARRGRPVALVAAARCLCELAFILLTRGEVYRAAA